MLERIYHADATLDREYIDKSRKGNKFFVGLDCAEIKKAAEPDSAVLLRVLTRTKLQVDVVRAAASLGWNPSNHLVRIHHVARLAVNAIGWIELEILARAIFIPDDLVDICWTKALAGVRKFLSATVRTNAGVGDEQVGRLIFFMFDAGEVYIGQFVKSRDPVFLDL